MLQDILRASCVNPCPDLQHLAFANSPTAVLPIFTSGNKQKQWTCCLLHSVPSRPVGGILWPAASIAAVMRILPNDRPTLLICRLYLQMNMHKAEKELADTAARWEDVKKNAPQVCFICSISNMGPQDSPTDGYLPCTPMK